MKIDTTKSRVHDNETQREAALRIRLEAAESKIAELQKLVQKPEPVAAEPKK